MTLHRLCSLLELPDEVRLEIKQYKSVMDEKLYEKIKEPEKWEQTINELKMLIAEDEFGFHILAELLVCACKTYEEYGRIGISESVFFSTMKFCTRFINEHKSLYGHYAFTWAWWFPRQLAMKEFRVGELEFEFVDGEDRKIHIHIPADANLSPGCVRKTIEEYRIFIKKYYPEWADVAWYCESWLLSPALQQLLSKNSNILLFQKMFDIESVDYESMAVLDWVFPGEKGEFAGLSEKTSLQRNMKSFLMAGNKVGWAKGRMRQKNN